MIPSGTLVRFVDDQNNERLGILLSDANEKDTASVFPLDTLTKLPVLALMSQAIAGVQSNLTAGGPPYWIAEVR